MLALIDGDILPYELGFAAEYGKDSTPSFDYVKELVDGRIKDILHNVSATDGAKLYLTGKGNFRDEVAIKKGYKANRKDSKKPFHFQNIRAYLKAAWGAEEVSGIEADDALAMEQTRLSKLGKPSIICSRDKDLRQVPGMHYSWECGKNQPEIGPYMVDELGEFWTEKLPKELKGTGYRFFAAQCLMGDKVDNIPGLPGWGPVKTYNYLSDVATVGELKSLLLEAYLEVYLPSYEDTVDAVPFDLVVSQLEEQAQLVWMVRELDEEGKPVMWRFNGD